MKIVAIVMVVAILLNVMPPTLAYAATYLQGAEANANTLVQDAYVQVTYRANNDQEKLAKGWIDTIGEISFTIREGGFKGKKAIAYHKVLSVIMSDESTVPAKQMNEVNRFIREMKAREMDTLVIVQHTRDIAEQKNVRQTQRHGEQSTQQLSEGEPRVRVYAPSIRKGWLVGKLIKKTQDTLVVRGELTLYGRRFYQVPHSSISNLEVSIRQHRNTFKGLAIGIGISGLLIIAILASPSDASGDSYLNGRGLAFYLALYATVPITTLTTILGAMTKSDKWVEVPPDRLDLSITPTSTKGLRAALMFNF